MINTKSGVRCFHSGIQEETHKLGIGFPFANVFIWSPRSVNATFSFFQTAKNAELGSLRGRFQKIYRAP